MQRRDVTPEEMGAIAQLAAENPDLRALPAELAQLRARAAATTAAPLRPATFRELLKAVDIDLLSVEEARPMLGLPARRGTLEALLAWVARPLQVVALWRRPRFVGPVRIG